MQWSLSCIHALATFGLLSIKPTIYTPSGFAWLNPTYE